MSLPTPRPSGLAPEPSNYLPTPPPTSSPYKPKRDGPPEQWPSTPALLQTYDDILLAQETAQDYRLQSKAANMWRESQEISCTEDNETTPWLKHTRWPERFQNRPLDVISASTRLPVQGLHRRQEDLILGSWRGASIRSSAAAEARIRVLMRAVDVMFDRAEATLACTTYQSRCWLTSYRNGIFRNRPLRIMSSSTGRQYKSRWKHFICYIFRALQVGPRRCREMHNMPLCSDDVKIMNHILGLASSILESEDSDDINDDDDEDEDSDNDSDDDSDDDDCENNSDIGNDGNSDNKGYCENSTDTKDDEEDGYMLDSSIEQFKFCLPQGVRLELSEALFQLSMMFWTYQSRDGVMDSSTIVHFTAALGVHRSSLAYRDAYNFTPDLAALIWIGRLLFLEYSLPQYSYDTLVYPWPERHTYPSQPERLEAIRKKYMLRGCYSPLSELIELKAFGKSIVRREGPRGTLTWASDGHSFTLHNDKVVRLSEFCTTYQASIKSVQKLVTEMMLGWEPTVHLSVIQDDLTCQLPGWCFLNKPENQLLGTYKAMSRRAWSSSFRGKALAKAGHWLPGSCLAYLQAGAELSTKGFASVHITAGLPGRGTETTTIRFRNTKLGIRNLFVRGGKVVIVISYTKARASNNHSFYVVRYLPDSLDQSIILYLAYIRPFLDFLANQLKLSHHHSNEFLFLDPKHRNRHMSSMQATQALRDLTRNLQTPWSISLYRQASIAIAKRHMSELIKRKNFYYPSDARDPIRMIAAGVGHRPRMLLTAYAIDAALPTRLQPELLEMYRQLSTLWQNWNVEYYNQHCVEECSISKEDAAQKLASEIQYSATTLASNTTATQKRRQSINLGSTGRCKRRKGVSTTDTSYNNDIALEASVEGFPKGFIHNAEYQILICVACESIISPGRRSFYDHLNRHRILGPVCKAYIERFSTLQLPPIKELSRPHQIVPAIPYLRVYRAFRCNVCQYRTTRWDTILDHMVVHKLWCVSSASLGDGKDNQTLCTNILVCKRANSIL